MRNIKLDETDWKIIEALQENARLKNNEIARRIGISEASVGNRIRAMEEQEALRIVLQRNLGPEYLSVLLYINIVAKDIKSVAAKLYEMEEALAVVITMGDPDLIVHVYVKDVVELQHLIDTKFSQFEGLFFKDMSISTELLKFDNRHRSEGDDL